MRKATDNIGQVITPPTSDLNYKLPGYEKRMLMLKCEGGIEE
jgi:hypothetical protein